MGAAFPGRWPGLYEPGLWEPRSQAVGLGCMNRAYSPENHYASVTLLRWFPSSKRSIGSR